TKTKLDGASAKLSLFLLFLCTGVSAQQTVFNVPSGDVLGRGKVYGELDLTYRPTNASGTLTPRIVVGVGHRIETGLNVRASMRPVRYGRLRPRPSNRKYTTVAATGGRFFSAMMSFCLLRTVRTLSAITYTRSSQKHGRRKAAQRSVLLILRGT